MQATQKLQKPDKKLAPNRPAAITPIAMYCLNKASAMDKATNTRPIDCANLLGGPGVNLELSCIVCLCVQLEVRCSYFRIEKEPSEGAETFSRMTPLVLGVRPKHLPLSIECAGGIIVPWCIPHRLVSLTTKQ